jgi:hypothetical protein
MSLFNFYSKSVDTPFSLPVFDAIVSNTKSFTLSSKDHFSKQSFTANNMSLPVPDGISGTPKSYFPFDVETVTGRPSTFS